MRQRGARFYRTDLHVHSYGASHDMKDAGMTPTAIVDKALSEGLGLLAITDHNDVTNVAAAIAHAHGRDLLVVPGIELSTSQGHLLCYLPTADALLDSQWARAYPWERQRRGAYRFLTAPYKHLIRLLP